jgi:hypothetical protein
MLLLYFRPFKRTQQIRFLKPYGGINLKNKDKEVIKKSGQVVENKETKYCVYLKQALCKGQEYSYAIERIFVKGKEQEEIRFTFYKATKDIHGKEFDKLVPRPLDVTEEELLELFKKATSDRVFSNAFLKNLKSILP